MSTKDFVEKILNVLYIYKHLSLYLTKQEKYLSV